MEDNTIRIISVQSKSVKGHAEKLKINLNYALKEANDTILYQKEEKYQVIYLQELTKNNPKLATLKRSTRLNIRLLREEHDEALNAAKDNGTPETIEELYKFCQTL